METTLSELVPNKHLIPNNRDPAVLARATWPLGAIYDRGMVLHPPGGRDSGRIVPPARRRERRTQPGRRSGRQADA